MKDKREFYSRLEISDSYDQQRFGGRSGARVNEREIEIALNMLPEQGRVLDLACGTGRLGRALLHRGSSVVALDYSVPMAAKTSAAGVRTVVADAFRTPFQNQSFDAVASLRFAFHCPDLEPLLCEMDRLTDIGGSIVFDTYSWSPRAAWAVAAGRWGGRVYRHTPTAVRALVARLGLEVERAKPCFLFSPYLYRLVPFRAEQAFEALENWVPASWLCRVFWKLHPSLR